MQKLTASCQLFHMHAIDRSSGTGQRHVYAPCMFMRLNTRTIGQSGCRVPFRQSGRLKSTTPNRPKVISDTKPRVTP